VTRLVQREELVPGFLRLRFAFPLVGDENGSALGPPHLAGGEHLKFWVPNLPGIEEGKWNGKADPEADIGGEVCRRYTPVAFDSKEGWFDVVVELMTPARAGPDGGKFSRFAAGLPVGEAVRASGPHGVYRYLGGSRFARGGGGGGACEEVAATEVAVIAAGVAANTVLALARAVVEDEAGPRLWIVVSARTAASLIHREAFERLAADRPKQIHLWFVLEKGEPPEAWPYGTGALADALSSEHLPSPGSSPLLISTGAAKVKDACQERFAALGYLAAPSAQSGAEAEGSETDPGSHGAAYWHWNQELDE